MTCSNPRTNLKKHLWPNYCQSGHMNKTLFPITLDWVPSYIPSFQRHQQHCDFTGEQDRPTSFKVQRKPNDQDNAVNSRVSVFMQASVCACQMLSFHNSMSRKILKSFKTLKCFKASPPIFSIDMKILLLLFLSMSFAGGHSRDKTTHVDHADVEGRHLVFKPSVCPSTSSGRVL